MEKKPPMCLSREEQHSLRALTGTAEETVELSQSLYNHVISQKPPPSTNGDGSSHLIDEPETKKALRVLPLPVIDEENGRTD
jgi:hypothetical protein